MAYRKKVYRRKAPKKTYKRKSYARKKVPLKKMIRREISRNIENKSIQNYNLDRTLTSVFSTFDSSSGPVGNIVTLGPDPFALNITQGVGQGQRIGNKIKTKRLTFKGTICPFSYGATYNPEPQPVQVKIFIFYDKDDPNAVPQPAANANFFQNGNSSTGFHGDLVDMWSPVNTDRYRVLTTKTFKLGFASATGTGSVPATQGFSNNDFKLNCNFSFDLTKHYPKYVTYNDTSTTPLSRGLWAAFVVANASGVVMGSGNRPCGIQYMQDYVYEDA